MLSGLSVEVLEKVAWLAFVNDFPNNILVQLQQLPSSKKMAMSIVVQ